MIEAQQPQLEIPKNILPSELAGSYLVKLYGRAANLQKEELNDQLAEHSEEEVLNELKKRSKSSKDINDLRQTTDTLAEICYTFGTYNVEGDFTKEIAGVGVLIYTLSDKIRSESLISYGANILASV